MIELNFTVIFQLAIVLILLVALSGMVFKPFLRVLQDRRDWVEGAERKARELQHRTEELMERHRDSMSTAQAQGASVREEIRKVGLDREAEILQKATEEANRFLEEMKGRIRDESQAARTDLRLEARNLAGEIAAQLLGRRIQ